MILDNFLTEQYVDENGCCAAQNRCYSCLIIIFCLHACEKNVCRRTSTTWLRYQGAPDVSGTEIHTLGLLLVTERWCLIVGRTERDMIMLTEWLHDDHADTATVMMVGGTRNNSDGDSNCKYFQLLDDRFTALANEKTTNPGLRNPHRWSENLLHRPLWDWDMLYMLDM